jgi:hypothetical protein
MTTISTHRRSCLETQEGIQVVGLQRQQGGGRSGAANNSRDGCHHAQHGWAARKLRLLPTSRPGSDQEGNSTCLR